ncbi:MAG: AAA family ATPase [Candidatus Limnocylindrales bacterium]
MTQAILGRPRELEQIDRFLDRVVGASGILLVEGAPGVGKTTLWLAGMEGARARGWRTLLARPTDAEATFVYAGIADLLEPVLDDALTALPGPQRRALRVALRYEEPGHAAPDARTVAVAFLNALRGLAAAGPVIVAVDDIQWLDAPSALAIGYAIRRLQEEPVGFLLTLRQEERPRWALDLDRAPAADRLARMVVGPLESEPLRQLLRARLEVPLPPAMLHRIEMVSAGNPFYALEIGRALGRGDGHPAMPEDLPVPDSLAALVGVRVEALPAPTRELLAIAALTAHPTVRLLAAVWGEPVEALLGPALDAHVVEVDLGTVRFTHPLLAAVTRSQIDPGHRRELHSRLAQHVADPEERASHLALAADAPDETVALALEQAAHRARARGAPDAASDLAALARRSTPSGDASAVRRRALLEAEYAMIAGDAGRARSIGEDVLANAPPGPARAEALVLLAQVAVFGLDLRAAVQVLREALAEVGDDDRLRMRCEGLLTAAIDRLGDDVPAALVHGRAELRLAERLGDAVHLATALRGLARNEQRHTGQVPEDLIGRALQMEPLVRPVRSVIEWPSVCHAEMLSWTDDLEAGLRTWEWLRGQAVERGEEHSLALILERLSLFETVAARWTQARAHADEGRRLAVAGGQVASEAALVADMALAEAHLGDEAATRRDAAGAMRLAGVSGANDAERTARWAMGLLDLSRGDPSGAAAWLMPVVRGARAAGIAEPGALRFVPDAIEALIGTGALADAEDLLVWYEAAAEASGRAHARAAASRCGGLLLAAGGRREAGFLRLEQARAQYEAMNEPFGRARTLLALGSMRRRALDRRAARTLLESAGREFESLSAARWAALAKRELARVSGRRTAGLELTPAEREVATLVAAGRTNREVAAALFLAERTVEGHLSSVYGKLGIRSRTELARTFGTGEER